MIPRVKFPAKSLTLTVIIALIIVLGPTSCTPAGEEDIPEGARLTFHENFETMGDIRENGGTVINGSQSPFITGFVKKGYWLGDGNNIFYPASQFINPIEGTIEFWICPKTRWNNHKVRHILSIGGLTDFSIIKDDQYDDLRLTLHGESIGFERDTSLLVRKYIYQWRSGWNHVAVTWKNLGNGDQGELILIVNGEEKNRLTGQLPRIDAHLPMVLGELAGQNGTGAIMDELKIYNYAIPVSGFTNVTQGLNLDPDFPLQVIPTPHPPGILIGEGFSLNSDTRIVVGREDLDKMEFALSAFNDSLESVFGYRLQMQVAGDMVPADNFITVGTVARNNHLMRLASTRIIRATPEDPGPGGYILEVFSDGIAVAGSDYRGAIKGLLTLGMIFTQYNQGTLPHLLLVDYPDMPFRGTVIKDMDSLDEELKGRLLYFASLGLSHVVYETDAWFDMDETPVAANLEELFEFTRSVGLEPIPLINTLSNAQKIIAECLEIGVDCSEGDDPETYCPNEMYVYEVIRRAVEDVVELLSPEKIHIGHNLVQSFNQDMRCLMANLSPAALFVRDIETIRHIIEGEDPNIRVMVWWDMLNPLKYRWRLRQSAPAPDSPPPPNIDEIAPRTVIWCPFGDTSIDPALQFLFPLSTLFNLRALGYGTYTAGPSNEDVGGAYGWIENGIELGAIGFLSRPSTTGDLFDENWLATTAAAEFAWSFFVPMEPDQVWYDFVLNNQQYGGYYP